MGVAITIRPSARNTRASSAAPVASSGRCSAERERLDVGDDAGKPRTQLGRNSDRKSDCPESDVECDDEATVVFSRQRERSDGVRAATGVEQPSADVVQKSGHYWKGLRERQDGNGSAAGHRRGQEISQVAVELLDRRRVARWQDGVDLRAMGREGVVARHATAS